MKDAVVDTDSEMYQDVTEALNTTKTDLSYISEDEFEPVPVTKRRFLNYITTILTENIYA